MRLDFDSNIASLAFAENGVSEDSAVISSQTRELLREGVKAAQAGNRMTARTLLVRATELEPNNENAWLWLASISEYPEELIVFLNNVLEINPHNERALEWMAATRSLLAKTFVQRGIDACKEDQTDFARQCFEQALARDENNEMAWLWLASIADTNAEKQSHLEKLLTINPTNEAAQNALKSLQTQISQKLLQKANQAAANGDRAAAEEMLAEVLETSPEFADAWILKAHLTDSFDEKIKSFEHALELEPANEAAKSALEALKNLMKFTVPQTNFSNFTAAPSSTETAEKIEETNAVETTDTLTEASANEDANVQTAEDLHVEPESPAEELTVQTADFPVGDITADDSFIEAVSHEDHPTDELETPAAMLEGDYFAAERAAEISLQTNYTEDVTPVSYEEPSVRTLAENVSTAAAETTDEEMHEDDFAPEHTNSLTTESQIGETENSGCDQHATVEMSAGDLTEEMFAADDPENESAASEDFNTSETEDFSHSENRFAENSEDFQPAPANTEEAVAEELNFYQTAQTEESHEDGSHDALYSDEWVSPQPETVSSNYNSEESVYFDGADSSPEQTAASETGDSFDDENNEETEQIVQMTATHEETAATAETFACPFCSSPNDAQAFGCRECRAVLSLSDLEMMFGNEETDKLRLQQIVNRMELDKNMRGFNADELINLGIGHLNLKNLRQGFAYLQEASRTNPNNVLLASQVNALAIRLTEIEQKEEVADGKPKGKTILVIDDSATVRKLISGKLEKSGHEVVCAVDGMDALAKLNEIVPDLILLDITMPRMDGYQVCKLIRNSETTKNIPVVMISGKDGFFDKVRGRMAGTTGYITKPFGPETLMKALEIYITSDEAAAN